MLTNEQEEYWSTRYLEENTGWDIGYPSTPIKSYIDQLDNKALKILIPGAGNAYEAEYLYKGGFKNVYVLDISELPLKAFLKRVPDFPGSQLLHADFFELEDKFDLIIEQTFFCSFEPTKDMRSRYAQKISELLCNRGKLVGLWFNHTLDKDAKRPFGGCKEEYLSYLEPYFKVELFEECYNSITPRMGSELFGIFTKKEIVQ